MKDSWAYAIIILLQIQSWGKMNLQKEGKKINAIDFQK